MSEETTQPPAPSGDSQESKKQTVRISLPPKPAAAPTIKIAVPPAGAAKTADDSGKAASTIKIPVPPKTAKPGVGVAKPAVKKPAAPPVEIAPAKENPAEAEAPPAAAEVAAAPVEAKAKGGKKKKAKVRKSAPAEGPLETAFAAVAALGAIGLALFLAMLGQLI